MQNRIGYPGSGGHGGVVSRFLIRVIRDLDKCYMSPLWGFGYLLCRVFYKHAAPLGLNEPTFKLDRQKASLGTSGYG